jgi:hypothetical protein
MSDEQEQERAQRFVERHFPEVHRFVAAERDEGLVPTFGPTEPRAGGDLPVYGPTEPLGDEENEPDVIVRVDFLMSRAQITTALGIAWAEIAGDREPESLSVREVRHEVEAWLSVQAFFALSDQMERDARQTFLPEQQHAMQVLAEAVDRAYPAATVGTPTPAVQTPRYGDGTVILDTLDGGEIITAEPTWCTGHDGEPVVHLVDITHDGPPVKASANTRQHGTVDVLDAHISHAPYAQAQPEPDPVISVRVDIDNTFTAGDSRHVARALQVAGLRLDRLAAETSRLRGEGR